MVVFRRDGEVLTYGDPLGELFLFVAEVVEQFKQGAVGGADFDAEVAQAAYVSRSASSVVVSFASATTRAW